LDILRIHRTRHDQWFRFPCHLCWTNTRFQARSRARGEGGSSSQTAEFLYIAGFIAGRFAKSQTVAAIVSVTAFVGIAPYVALPLKTVTRSFTLRDKGEPTA
jgi:hypothetical protein